MRFGILVQVFSIDQRGEGRQIGLGAFLVGRTPWSARVPLDPLSVAAEIRAHEPTRGSAADQGVRPTRTLSGPVLTLTVELDWVWSIHDVEADYLSSGGRDGVRG